MHRGFLVLLFKSIFFQWKVFTHRFNICADAHVAFDDLPMCKLIGRFLLLVKFTNQAMCSSGFVGRPTKCADPWKDVPTRLSSKQDVYVEAGVAVQGSAQGSIPTLPIGMPGQ